MMMKYPHGSLYHQSSSDNKVPERKHKTIHSQTWNKTAWLSTIPMPVLHFIITIKLEPYRLLFCPAVKLIFYSLATTPEPLLFIRHMNSPEGCFGGHASLWGELGTTAHETVIKTHLLEDWHWASPLQLKHVLCLRVFLCIRVCTLDKINESSPLSALMGIFTFCSNLKHAA